LGAREMNISLVIPAFNEEREIAACLDSVLEDAHGRLNEIIVVDNASTDRTAEIARGYPKVRTVSETRKGVGYARQCGLQEASGDLIAFIDADVRLPAGWLDTVERVFEGRPDIVALSGPYRFHDGPKWRRWVLAACWAPLPLASRFLGTLITGGNFLARKQALETMGGFDPTISFYGQDPDIARRIKTQGKVLYRSNFFVYSSSRRYDAEGLFATNAKYVVNFLWIFLFQRHFSTTHHDIRPTDRTDVL
jgi:glycosyltransferase involved in cell wall biosynthesis